MFQAACIATEYLANSGQTDWARCGPRAWMPSKCKNSFDFIVFFCNIDLSVEFLQLGIYFGMNTNRIPEYTTLKDKMIFLLLLNWLKKLALSSYLELVIYILLQYLFLGERNESNYNHRHIKSYLEKTYKNVLTHCLVSVKRNNSKFWLNIPFLFDIDL